MNRSSEVAPRRGLVCAAAPEQESPKPSVPPPQPEASTAPAELDAAAPIEAPPGEAASSIDPTEVIKFQGTSSTVELIISLLLGTTLVFIPLTLASVGRFLWTKHTFTNKRLILDFNSPIRKETVQVTYDKVKEVRSVSRGFGLWGDMVFFLKDGSRVELVGIDDHIPIRVFVEGEISL